MAKKAKNPGITKGDPPFCVGTRKGSQQSLFPIYVCTTFHIPIPCDPLVNANKPKHKYRSHAATMLFYTGRHCVTPTIVLLIMQT